MYKVKQAKLLQATNVQLVGIRQAEMMYYSNYFQTFGGVGAMIAGFLFGSLTQILGLYVSAPRWVRTMYWLTSTISFLAGLHIMLATTFCHVYGQGKALYGKLGAVTEVINGYAAEEKAILWGFVVMFFFYGFSIIGTCGLVYYEPEAIAGTVITCIFMIMWYRDGIMIYNLFKWTEQDELEKENEWKDDSDDSDDRIDRQHEKGGKGKESGGKEDKNQLKPRKMEDNITRANRLMEEEDAERQRQQQQQQQQQQQRQNHR